MKNLTTAHICAYNRHTIQKKFIRFILLTLPFIVTLSCITPLTCYAQSDNSSDNKLERSLSTLFHSMNKQKISNTFFSLTDTFGSYVTLSFENLAIFLDEHLGQSIDETTSNNEWISLFHSTDSIQESMVFENATAPHDELVLNSGTVSKDSPFNFNDNIAILNDYTDLNNGLSTVYTKLAAPAPLTLTREESISILYEYALNDDRFQTIINDEDHYSDELLAGLANNPEMLIFAELYTSSMNNADYLEPDVVLTEAEKDSKCPLFLQWDPRWGYTSYGVNYMAVSGCGPTALSMVIQGLTDQNHISPYDVATFAMENNYYMAGSGTKWDLMLSGASHFGLTSYCIKIQESLMKECLDNNSYLICSMSAGDFTALGHFIVIHGYNENGFLINDPFCYERSQQTWSFNELYPQIKSIWTLSAT